MKTLSTALIMLFFLGQILGQPLENSSKSIPKNIFYPSVGIAVPVVFWGTADLNYERLITQNFLGPANKFYLRGSLGAWAAYGAGGSSYALGGVMLTGRKTFHLEMALGFGRYYNRIAHLGDSIHPPGTGPKCDYVLTFPLAGLALRIQKPTGLMMLKVGAAFPQGFQLGIGFCL